MHIPLIIYIIETNDNLCYEELQCYVAARLPIPRCYRTVCVLFSSTLENHSGVTSRLMVPALSAWWFVQMTMWTQPAGESNVLFFFSLGWPLSPAGSIQNESLIKPGFFASGLLQGCGLFLLALLPRTIFWGIAGWRYFYGFTFSSLFLLPQVFL